MFVRICILDDLEAAALTSADWSVLEADEIVAIDRHVHDRLELSRLLEGFDVVVAQRERTRFDEATLRALPGLRLLVTTGQRNAAIDLATAEELGITVCGTTNTGTPSVELAWALILAAIRGIPEHDAAMHAGSWNPRVGRSLEGRTLGLLGLGTTGRRMSRIANAFDMRVTSWSENLTPEVAAANGARYVSKDELFGSADVVSVHLLLSDRTRDLVGASELRLMKGDAWLVNTSRGPICNEAALIQASTEHWIAGVALDVYDQEPLPVDHPLRGLPNVVLTPHVGYVTQECLGNWFGDVVEDVAAWAEGSPLRVLRHR